MTVRLTVKRKLIVNGKEYGSIDELPETIRKALVSQISTNPSKKACPEVTKTKLVFNTQEYSNTDEMPPNVREAYHQALQITGLTTPQEISTEVPSSSRSFQAQKAIVPVSGASRVLRIWIPLGGLSLMLYFVFFFLR